MQSNDQIAVFLDIENFIGFSNALKLPIDLSEILEKLKEEGRIIIRRSFGDLVKALAGNQQIKEADNVRRMLRDNLFIHEDIAYQNQFKNSADMRLAVEMLYTAFTVPNITKFAVIAADSDYVPVFQKLQEQNKMVIGIAGSERGTSVIYRRACDSIYYVEDIFRRPIDEVSLDKTEDALVEDQKLELKTEVATAVTIQTAAPVVPEQSTVSTVPFDYQAIRDEYANLLVRAVKILEQSGKPSNNLNLTQQMRQLKADFNYERAGFESFQELVRFAAEQSLVAIEQRDNSFNVYLPESTPISAQTISTAIYRKHIQERIKCQLPAARVRDLICQKTHNVIGYNSDDGGILLRDLSHDVTDGLADEGINVPQPEVYKYLFSLFKSRCFECQNSDYGDFNPFIVDYRVLPEQWDDRFVVYQIKQLAYDNIPLFTQKLSSLFFETEDKARHIRDLLNKEGIKYEI
ncbi:MAG TPA: NYN domain-containing protein [Pyrinomonadaceae bacterium]|jgi:uncharacterized LabA/DUF88 family protein